MVPYVISYHLLFYCINVYAIVLWYFIACCSLVCSFVYSITSIVFFFFFYILFFFALNIKYFLYIYYIIWYYIILFCCAWYDIVYFCLLFKPIHTYDMVWCDMIWYLCLLLTAFILWLNQYPVLPVLGLLTNMPVMWSV